MVENNEILYEKENVQVLYLLKNARKHYKYNKCSIYGIKEISKYVQILEWFKNYGYGFKYNKLLIVYGNVQILEFFKKLNVKKVIKWSKSLNFNKTIKYKTKNNYIKGYNKNWNFKLLIFIKC